MRAIERTDLDAAQAGDVESGKGAIALSVVDGVVGHRDGLVATAG